MEVVGRAGDAAQLIAIVEAQSPDVVITDIRMPPTHTTEGLAAAVQIRESHPKGAVDRRSIPTWCRSCWSDAGAATWSGS